MTTRFPPLLRALLLVAVLAWTGAGPLAAQYELKSPELNALYKAGSGVSGLPAGATGSQFQSVGVTSAASGPRPPANPAAAATGNLPAGIAPVDLYPSTPASLEGARTVLKRSHLGNAFAAGVPRYLLGDVVTPPVVQIDGVTPAAADYWRIQPVFSGESFNQPTGAQDGVVIPANTVPSVYYSPHARRVFAHQAGRVSVTWVTREAVAYPTDPVVANRGLRFRYKPETFSVSSATQKPVRTIYWTERSFSSPYVTIPTGSIETVNPVYSALFPATVATEYKPVGVSENPSPNASAPDELRTLWFEKLSGIGQLHAYNIEGRVFVEYLGALEQGSTTVHQFLGADIVEVGRVAPATNVTVNLGDRLTPRDGQGRFLPLDGGPEWLASPVLNVLPDPQPYYSSFARANGTLDYYAERENENPDRVVFYWLQQTDAAIHFFAPENKPDLGIYWPVVKNHYAQAWPSELGAYAHYTVATSGSLPATGIQFPDGSVPQIVFQDDGSQTETTIDTDSQRLVVSLVVDGLNRTLLKFINGTAVWYVRLYTQAENRAGFQEGDSAAALSAAAVVGERIDSPSGYLNAGYIAAGAGYNPDAYRDPFAVGAVAAQQGAIIPVNAIPGQNQLSVWWFKRVEPPSGAFTPFYVPAKVGRYTVSYPASPSRIVLASNAGGGDLSGSEIAGSLYVQNDRAQPGFNPNEEHALMLGGRIYALRDDLNNTGSDPAAYTSRPFALLSYTSPADQRPAMRAFEIVREVDAAGTAADFRFDYPIAAGTILQGPMPLPLLPLPVRPSGVIANTEVPGIPDGAHQGPALYDKFTYKDRKGYDWVYRGPHSGVAAAVSPLPVSLFDSPGDTGIWGNSSGLGNISVSEGIYSATVIDGSIARIEATALNFSANDVPAVLVRLRANAGVSISLEWTTPSTLPGTFDGWINVPYSGNGDWQTLALDLSASQEWAGRTITGLRLVFSSGSGATVGVDWIGTPSLAMQFYYAMRESFYVPGVSPQPAVGTILPYLRPLANGSPVGHPVTGTPLTIHYRPFWPALAPELRVAETLTLAKFGLPEVFNQASARVLYQQSVADRGDTSSSVTLFDPVREKVFLLGGPILPSLPASLRTTVYSGKTYFQGLPPHLQKRFYFDPARGLKGGLVLVGKLNDVVAGEDYLDLNVLTEADQLLLEKLVPSADALAGGWFRAIDEGLKAQVETFIPDPLKAGSFKVGSSVARGGRELVPVTDSDTAVVDYALTATGKGSGWVTMVFGDGRAFTPQGDPVALKVFKVAPRLYTGDLKVNLSANPLDEQVTLRHSADFAARAEDYEFEWRYAIPQDGSAPPTYSYSMGERVIPSWKLAVNPDSFLPRSDFDYASAVPLPRTLDVNAAGAPSSADFPGSVIRPASDVNFVTVPAQVVFSADLGDYTGFVLYVNGVAALAYTAPASFPASVAFTDLAAGALGRQFSVPPSYFRQGDNRLEIALYSTADLGATTTVNFKLHASTETELVTASGTPWLKPSGTLSNQIVVGGDPAAPLGSPLLVMADNYFTLRYRPKSADNVAGTGWSRWMQPVLVEGWIKRVLAAINPFNQRMADLANNAVNTDVSLLTSAGKRWEGDIALTLENINDVGLIEIYETVLNRGKNISIDAGYDAPAVNDALLLAAGYLSDLYTILGNEAYADAANPTISIDSGNASTITEVNTSRFSFEAQVASVLDEELALLRGRDDFASPGVSVAPAYNRLYWNYTRGINSGEALYAVNYNIREKAGSGTADGKIDAADAQRMFPQGHGDAYGHYLTALTGYYRLLQNPNFTWTPRSEAVTVLGQAVQIDYFDERKFAGAASSLARASSQILSLTYRASYNDDPASGWAHFRDGKPNSSTGATRRWGLDEWTARSTQGAYFHWLVGNALLPEKDVDPTHTGVEIIDRTTVPELAELATAATDFQTTIDNANAHLNPLGLSPGAIAFDISPSELQAGKTHYEQIHERALRAVLNAKGSFDQAAKMTRLLRNQENQVDDYNAAIVDQERSFVKQLLEIYGSPYSGDIGAGKTYAQGYAGPDLINWFVIDRPTNFVDTAKTAAILAPVPTGVITFTGDATRDIKAAYNSPNQTATRLVVVQPDRFVQYADTWATLLGQRGQVGAIQQSLLDAHQAHVALLAADAALRDRQAIFIRRHELYMSQLDTYLDSLAADVVTRAEIKSIRLTQTALRATAAITNAFAESQASSELKEFLPLSNGLSNDLTSTLRGTIKATNTTIGRIAKGLSVVATNLANQKNNQILDQEHSLQLQVEALNVSHELRQSSYEYEILYRELMRSYYEIADLAANLQRATERVRTVIAEGDRLLADREVFRLRAAALIQGYRTKDLAFRTFRNEALEQYRSLFDLASRYTYLSAKSYDYETGLLGTAEGNKVVANIVAARSLGDLTGGVPQATTSTLGDSGLAGTMARLQSDWSVAKGRLGINNPDPYGTAFSLRRELYRLRDDASSTADDAAWQQTLQQHIVANVLADPQIAAACRNLKKADGSAVPGIVISFRTTIEPGLNFFGLPLAAGDHAYSTTSYATKIHSAGLVLRGYVGMNPYAVGTPNAGAPNSTDPNALSATPYIYLIPTGADYMLAPPLGDTGALRSWNVKDQALPLPFNLGATAFNTTQFFNANGTLSEQPWILRKHQAFRAVADAAFFYNPYSSEFTNTRLVGRSVWNGGWKIVIPANTLLANEQDGLNRFVASVKDIELFLRTYSHSGN